MCLCTLSHWGILQAVIWLTHVKGKLAREVVHAAGVHETESVSDGLGTERTLACDWTDPSISQCGCHDAAGLACHLNRAQLEMKEWHKHILCLVWAIIASSTFKHNWYVSEWQIIYLKVEVKGCHHVNSTGKTLQEKEQSSRWERLTNPIIGL